MFRNQDNNMHLLRNTRGIEINDNSDDLVVQFSNVSNPGLPHYQLNTSVRDRLFIPIDLFKYIINTSIGNLQTIDTAIKHSNRIYLKETFRFIIY